MSATTTTTRLLALARLEGTDAATYGHFTDEENRALCVTLELPDRGNAPNVSRIPAGTYTCRLRYSAEHQRMLYWIDDVPGRGCVEIHAGCIAVRDSKGCVLTGTAFGFVDYADGKPNASGHGVTGAQDAEHAFMRALGGVPEFTLTIIDPPAAPAFPAPSAA